METPDSHESQRLEKQASLFGLMHQKALDLALSREPDASLFLDIGCGNGASMRDLPFSRVIGIDRNPDALQSARERFPDYNFFQIDIESDQFPAFLQERAPAGPIIARLSFSLHHLQNPLVTLQHLRDSLPNGSVLLVLTPDQEMSCAYPGENFEALLEHSKNFPDPLADARHGRKLGSQLRDAGYRDVMVAPYIFTTAGVRDAYKRQLLFAVFNDFRLQKWQRAVRDGKPGARKGLQKTEELLRRLQKQFQDPSFFFMTTMMIGVGRV